ncbi:head-tail adaptor protein [Sphingobium sp. JS3065]|uniref:head-tail adaptor protein n=1 Tax=Sphingobium sp. JS3065 TaxID=2970925 RepID=UPI0022640B7C|nr:head-tail adaptor protein [Sphingobium sp. JS3065]UZW54055.1 head-tail adaptor protein [Sphingobium sp. JS3065]
MKARNRPFLIVIEARTTVEDSYGGEQETWAEFGQEYAAVYYGTGSEQREAAQQGGSQVASFEVLSNGKTRAISVINHRIAFDGGIWNITAKQDLGLNEGVRLTAIRAAT